MEAAESPSPKDYPLYSLRKSSSSASSESVLFQKDCVFCNVLGHIRVKVAGSWMHQQTSKFEYGGEQSCHTISFATYVCQRIGTDKLFQSKLSG